MPAAFWTILLAIVAVQAVDALAEFLNIRSLGRGLPPEFAGLYDPEKYRKSQDYARARARLHLVSEAAGLATLVVFWTAGGFEWLDLRVRGWGLPLLATGLLYLGLFAAASQLLSLPFSLYGTFVVEERFGFNRTTLRTFLLDRLKGWLLAALLGGPLTLAILAFFHYIGPRAWLYAWAAAALFQLFVQFIAPTWIMPLFNKFIPLPDGELKTAILDYARSVGFSLQNIFVMDGSKRSSKTNAFFTGFGKNKRIALFDTLIEKHSTPELVAVLAHEIGHYKMRHILKGLLVSLAHYGMMFWLLSLFLRRPELFAAFRISEPSVYAGLLLFGLVYAPLSFLLGVGLNAYSRRNEFEADRYAVRTAPEPGALARALKTLSVSNLSNLTPHPFYVFLKYSHPPLLQRLAALKGAGNGGRS